MACFFESNTSLISMKLFREATSILLRCCCCCDALVVADCAVAGMRRKRVRLLNMTMDLMPWFILRFLLQICREEGPSTAEQARQKAETPVTVNSDTHVTQRD